MRWTKAVLQNIKKENWQGWNRCDLRKPKGRTVTVIW
jgi:hypothetical protein